MNIKLLSGFLLICILIFMGSTYVKYNVEKNALLKMKQEKLVSLLKVYSIFEDKVPLELLRLGKDYDGGYIVAKKALETADILLGYGIADDASFEDQFSLKFQKPSYGFDCSIDYIEHKSSLFSFVKECIGDNNHLYNSKNSNQKISTFKEELDALNINNKKLFIKMDIEGAEYSAFETIFPYHDLITGIALEIHFNAKNSVSLDQAIHLLSTLDNNFVLIHVHGNNCVGPHQLFTTKNADGYIPEVLELSYINKDIIKNYEVAHNQQHPLALDMPNTPHAKDIFFEILY